MSSSFVDTAAITQVIGCVFNNSTLLDNTDQYIIREDDFTEVFHRVLFGAMYHIHTSGSKVNLDAIVDYLANRPKYDAIFKTNKGTDYLLEASRISKPETFNYYYHRMKKFTLLRTFDNCGIEVKSLYDPDNILDTKKRQKQEDWLDSVSLVDIANIIDKRIEDVKLACVSDDLGLGYQAGDGLDDLIAGFKERPEVGIPLYGPLINTVTRGARLRKLYLRSAATGQGKAIPNNVSIPTPQGWRLVGEIRPGDQVFGRDGEITTVTNIFPQGEKRVWKVIFADGREAECCEDHLWTYRYETHRGHAYRTESVKEIMARIEKLKNGFKDSCNKGYRFHIPLNEPVNYPTKTLPLHPYIMGALLGDGSFRYRVDQKALSFSSESDEMLENIVAFWPGVTYRKSSDLNYNYTFKPIDNIKHNIWVEEALRDFPQLWNKKSEDKFIPDIYLQGDVVQRFFLLEGLLDTDGGIDEKGRVHFTTISPYLRDQIIELCHSLGMIASWGIDKRAEKYTTGECYNVYIQCKKALKPCLFRLSRKRDIAINYSNSAKREEWKDHLAIVDIQLTSSTSEMTCFTVDNDDHLFLINDYLVTHNTRSMIADACNFACDEIYHDAFGWIRNGKGQPTLFIATEQDKGEVQTMMLAFLSAVNEEHILNGQYLPGEEERVLKAAEIIKRSPIWIEELPDFSLQDVENKIKKNIRKHNVTYVLFDYLQTSMKILEEIAHRSGGVRLREDNILFMLSARLKDIANKYGIFILTATQLNDSWRDSETPDQGLLRGAKSIAD